MAELTMNTIVTGIIVLLVVVVVAIIVINPDLRDKILNIADETFHTGETPEAKTNTLEAHNKFIETIEACDGGVYNPKSKNACFCISSVFGIVSDKSYLYLQNQDNSLTVTAVSENQEPLAQTKEEFSLGIMINKDNTELGCIYPSELYLQGIQEGESDLFGVIGKNIVYLVWKDERANKYFWEYENADYNYQFYMEGNEEDHPELATSPILYRVDSTHYCLITDLIESPISTTTTDNYQSVTKISSFDDAKTFLLNSNLYCHKL